MEFATASAFASPAPPPHIPTEAEEEQYFIPPFIGILKLLLSSGYNLLYSILELIDNSISKKATLVQTIVRGMDDTEKSLVKWISVLDDAVGMSYQKLRESFIIAFVKNNRDLDDIGGYSVGMKFAVMNMGRRIVILTKVSGGQASALYVDIDMMRDNNKFKPTRLLEVVTQDFINEHVPLDLYERFMNQDSGTLIIVKDLKDSYQRTVSKAVEELSKGISNSYSTNVDSCKFTIEAAKKVIQVKQLNIFYDNQDEHLDEPAYETELYVYRGKPGYPNRIFEKNVSVRRTKGKTTTTGTIASPVYYEYVALEKKEQYHMNMSKPTRNLPPDDCLIGTAQLRVIQVKDANFKNESQYFKGSLEGDRKGIWFNRTNRVVGHAMRLGKKLHDRTTMAAERQRMRVTFQSGLDDIVGSKFNKQMENKELPCEPLNDAIYSIYKQVTTPWVAKWSKMEESDKSAPESEEEVQVKPVAKVQNSNVLNSIHNATNQQEPVINQEQKEPVIKHEEELVMSEDESIEDYLKEASGSSEGTESVSSRDSIPVILETNTFVSTEVPEVPEVPEEKEDDVCEDIVPSFVIDDGKYKVMDGDTVIAEMPYVEGLEQILETLEYPPGKTIVDAVKHFSLLWTV